MEQNYEIEIEVDDWTDQERADERMWKRLRGKGRARGWNLRAGVSHPSWKGGLFRPSENQRMRWAPEVYQWRQAVWKRDSRTCRLCNESGKELVAHHIYPWAEFPLMRICVSNGVTLCDNCHIWTHKHIGWHPTHKRKAWLNGFPNGV